jgi:hypothetical protein
MLRNQAISFPNQVCDVAYWHFSDMPTCATDVCFRGVSRHVAGRTITGFMSARPSQRVRFVLKSRWWGARSFFF